MSYFLLYLFTMVEKIAAFLAIGGSIFFWSTFAALATYGVAFVLSKDKESLNAWVKDTKPYRRTATILATCGALMFTTSALMPTKRDLAIIVVGGATYNVLTSDKAKEMGGQAIKLLQQQMEEALNDKDVQSTITEHVKGEVKDAISGASK